MNRFFLFVTLVACLATGTRAYAQGERACLEPDFFCHDITFSFDQSFPGPDNETMCPDGLDYWFVFEVNTGGLNNLTINSPDILDGFSLFGPFSAPLTVTVCDAESSAPSVSIVHNVPAMSYNTNALAGPLPAGYYFLNVRPSECNSSFSFSVGEDEKALACKDLSCENCVGSFTPEPGKKYVLSAWSKEHNAPVDKTAYEYPEIWVEYPTLPASEGPFSPQGQLVEGWQRIEGEFTPPIGATFMRIRLKCITGDCYFDDIRVHPFDGSMKTYVYDPHTLRLSAELDERNYATFYEYDEEGKLVRIKKETERGVMTIQETKTSVVKK